MPMNMLFLSRSARLFALLLAGAVTCSAHAERLAKKPGNIKKISTNQADAGEFANFVQWKEVADFIGQMVTKHGFSQGELEAVLGKARYVETTIQLIKPAPASRPKNWQAYRARFVEPGRINAGARFWNEHAQALAKAEEQYGVPAEIIVGILGVETIYGRNTGNFRVIDALTTLAFDYPDTPTRMARMAFFRGELEQTLLFAREAGIDPLSLLGSYAGAIGLPQFMPGSIRQFAVDFDGDGTIDLRNSPIDAIGSVANFLKQHGWKRGEPIVFPASVAATTENGTRPEWEALLGQGLEAKYGLDTLKTVGVLPTVEIPADMVFGLVDLQNGFEPTEYWLGGNNFFSITRYNRSFFYAMSVVELGRAVLAARNQ
jgi:membrane-bound lytic murein transglycosylase B